MHNVLTRAKACPIYDQDFIDLYRERDNNELDPHIYSIANNAFTQMAQFGRDQSIIVTGESGAGKTVSAKFSMKFFAAAGGGKGEESGKENVNQKVPSILASIIIYRCRTHWSV